MKENEKKGISRRKFLGLSALGLASFTILPSWSINGVRIAPSDRVVLGFIRFYQFFQLSGRAGRCRL
nr:twin-arginine translocation signal domain-containing protein [Parabacteroides goldsteinii]